MRSLIKINESFLQHLDYLETPIWILDIERETIWWANPPAVRLWGANDKEALLAREFTDMTEATRARLSGYLEGFKKNQRFVEYWTFYPDNTPQSMDCSCSGVYLPDNRLAMLVEGRRSMPGPLQAEDILKTNEARLQQSEERYRLLLNNSPVGILHYDPNLVVTYANGRFEDIMQVPKGYMLGLDCNQLQDQSVVPPMRRAIAGEYARYEGPYVTTHGHLDLWISMACAPVVSESGEIVGGIVILEDITERKRADAELRLAASVFSHAHEGIMICNANRVIVDVNPTFTEITGFTREDVIGHTPKFLSSGHHGKDFYRTMWQTIQAQGHWEGELWNRRKDGTSYVERLTISTVCDEKGRVTHYIGSFSDITVVKEQQAQLEYLAHYDTLTQLPNRALLSNRMDQALKRAKRTGLPMAVCYLDLDGFKAVNDELGHDAGDTLLVEVAHRLKESVRAGDTVARLGGDEFALLLVDITDATECQRVVSRALDLLAAPIWIDKRQRFVSGSLGIALFPDDDKDPETLLRYADQAMYAAKQAGKNCYQFYNAAQGQRTRSRRVDFDRID